MVYHHQSTVSNYYKPGQFIIILINQIPFFIVFHSQINYSFSSLSKWVIRKRYNIHSMNISKKLPPIPSKSGKRILSPLEEVLNKDNTIFKVLSKPLSKQSVPTIEEDNEEISYRRGKKISIQKVIPRCRSSKNVPDRRPLSCSQSIGKVSKQQISGKQIANLPYITAKSWAIFEVNTSRIIYGKRQDIRRQVASLTKIANLITILEILAENNLEGEKIFVTVTRNAAQMIGTTAEIRQGMVISLNDLLYGMMLPSGNDAAFQIALIGGTIINLARQNFKLQNVLYDRDLLAHCVDKYNNNIIVYLNKMNTLSKLKAKTVNTSFANPHGLSNVNSLSTAEDMARLSAYAMKNEKFREVVQTKSYSGRFTKIQPLEIVNDENINPNLISNQLPLADDKKRCEIYWENTNKMLWRGFSGIKTGITPNAGPCLAASVQRTIDGKEYEFVMILLKSYSMEARWKQVQGLAEWATQFFKK